VRENLSGGDFSVDDTRVHVRWTIPMIDRLNLNIENLDYHVFKPILSKSASSVSKKTTVKSSR
jgi:hypothetical protein